MNAATASAYSRFFALGPQTEQDRRQRQDELNRQIEDHGLSYNVYSQTTQPQRPWSLELFPLLIDWQEWQAISDGITQRAAVLEHIAADVYGPCRLLDAALIPNALVYGHPGFFPALQSEDTAHQSSREYLQLIAFDLARQPDGNWAVLSQRTQAPSGLGYALANRLLISRQHADAFQALNVQPWTQVLRRFMDGLARLNPQAGPTHIALLSPGPFNETYFEQVYLARQFGLTLVEGHDLVVRNNQVFLKTLKGLERVHVVIKRMDDAYLDPLRFRADSTLGTPGLLNAYLSGQVAIINAPGLAFLESPALMGFLPGVSEAVTGKALRLASADTWWCGEPAARASAAQHFSRSVLKPSYPQADGRESFETVLLPLLSPSEQDQWRRRIDDDPEAYAVQSQLALGEMPVWRDALSQQPYLLRVFALRTGPGADDWQVMPGGMARVVGQQQIASMQRGGSSADVWLITDPANPLASVATPRTPPVAPPIVHRGVTSRAAENLFWMGRYTERSENSLRLAQVRLDTLLTENQSPSAMTDWLGHLWHRLGPTTMANSTESPLDDIINSLGQVERPQSLAFHLSALRRAATAVRDRLSHEHWRTIEDCLVSLQSSLDPARYPSAVTALKALEVASRALASMTGAQSDRMLRDDGWQLLMIGRLLERLSFLTHALGSAARAGVLPQSSETVYRESAVGLVLTRLFEINASDLAPLPAQPPRRRLMDLFLIHDQSPRSLTWVAMSLRKRLSKLAQTPMGEPDALAQIIALPGSIALKHLVENDPALEAWLEDMQHAVWTLSDKITQQYFVHVHVQDTSLGG